MKTAIPGLPILGRVRIRVIDYVIKFKDAKSARCGNCAAFNQTKEILDCIASAIGGKEAWDVIDAGDLGYCEFYDFKCASSRTCDAWVAGGPVKD